jgi:hypothetical protein
MTGREILWLAYLAFVFVVLVVGAIGWWRVGRDT